MARKQPKTADSLPLVAIDLGSDSVRAMAARRIAPDLFEILGVEERAHKQGNICIENGVITQSSSAGYIIAEVLKLLANRIGNLWFNIESIGYQSISTPLAWIFSLSTCRKPPPTKRLWGCWPGQV